MTAAPSDPLQNLKELQVAFNRSYALAAKEFSEIVLRLRASGAWIAPHAEGILPTGSGQLAIQFVLALNKDKSGSSPATVWQRYLEQNQLGEGSATELFSDVCKPRGRPHLGLLAEYIYRYQARALRTCLQTKSPRHRVAPSSPHHALHEVEGYLARPKRCAAVSL